MSPEEHLAHNYTLSPGMRRLGRVPVKNFLMMAEDHNGNDVLEYMILCDDGTCMSSAEAVDPEIETPEEIAQRAAEVRAARCQSRPQFDRRLVRSDVVRDRMRSMEAARQRAARNKMLTDSDLFDAFET